jgi:nucleoside-diphosphate-sugar epimerase
MRIFVTGATGFIGTALVPELIQAGHHVLGLTRSEAGAQALRAAGAQPHSGTLEDHESLRAGAAQSDGVIHCAFNHDFSQFAANCELDRRAIETLGSALAGSTRPLLITSGTALGNTVPGQPATEESFDRNHPTPRIASELAALSMAERGLNVSIIRLPQVHDPVKQGLITYAVAIACEKGLSAYIGDGSNRWPAAHVLDVARLYRLAFEKALEKPQSATRYHAVAEEGVSMRAIAEILGRGLKLPVASISPEEAPAHFGWLSAFASRDLSASGAWTQQHLNWRPTGPTLLADLEQMQYA